MNNPPASLRAFVDALRVDASGAIHLAGQRLGTAGTGPAKLTMALTGCVYEHVYARPFPRVTEPGPAQPDGELTDLLEHANATRSRVEHGWSVLERAPDGSVIAVRHGRSRRLIAGQFLVADGALPAAAGADLLVQLPSGSRLQQPGFYYCFSEGFTEANDTCPVVRLYFNVGIAGAASLIRLLTAALNRHEIAFQLKVTTRRSDFARTDNAVLYLPQDGFHVAALALQPVIPAIEATLNSDVPLFTKRLGRGIGFAEDPGPGESFGTSRSKLVAAALVAARSGDEFPCSSFLKCFADAIAAAKLAPKALYLHPGSEDIYELVTAS
jgi:hypothetical protein